MQSIFDNIEQDVAAIKANDSDVICQASIFEYVSMSIEYSMIIPQYVWDEFGVTPSPDSKLNYLSMLYDENDMYEYFIYGGSEMSAGQLGWMPDITKLHTQMWFYYLATSYIDRGCEAIHFGQAEVMNRRDIGNKEFWGLLQRIRNYAASRNRGVVILDAHTPYGGMYYEPNLDLDISEWQGYSFDPDHNWDKQLLWDFHSLGVGFEENLDECTQDIQPILLYPHTDEWLHKRSFGGLNPQGWYTSSNPYLAELDHGGISDHTTGCNFDNTQESYFVWGWDEMSWFAEQPEDYRNDVLRYAYHKIKCMDKSGHLCMPGMRGVINVIGDTDPNYIYRANTGHHNQQTTIKDIWNNNTPQNSTSIDWVHFEFYDDIVSNAPNAPYLGNVRKDLIFVGNDKMFYIGNDQRIHGFIKVDETWISISPSLIAHSNGQDIDAQQKAAHSLVANPSGTFLYYVGTNGLVYRYKIVDKWTYDYSEMPTNGQMDQQSLTVHSSLICPTDNSLYYIGFEKSNKVKKRIHGFIYYNNDWTTVSPSWSAHFNGQHILTQQEPISDLIANPSVDYLYHIGIDGLIYRFHIKGLTEYIYSEMPTNSDMQHQGLVAYDALICPTDDQIYYIAKEQNNSNKTRIHGFVNYSSSWQTTSPSWSAHGNGQDINTQTEAIFDLTYSPDDKLLVYLGDDYELHAFKIENYFSFSYFNFPIAPYWKKPHSNVKFRDKESIFYIDLLGSKVHCYLFDEDYCSHPIIDEFEPDNCSHCRSESPSSSQEQMHEQKIEKIEDINIGNDYGINIYPNPSSIDFVTLTLDKIPSQNNLIICISDLSGKRVIEKSVKHINQEIKINTSSLDAGIYFISVKSKETMQSAKFVVSK